MEIKRLKKRWFPALLIMLAWPPLAGAEPVPLRVETAEGKLLENAVVTVHWEGAAPKPPPEEPALMVQRDRRFIPHVLVVPRGSLVDFPNQDNTRHHVYSFSPAKTFDIKLYASRPEKPIHFDRTGIVVLGCNIHDRMKAYILVVEAPRYAVSGTRGRLALDLPADRPLRVRAWHPWAGSGEDAWQEWRVPGREALGKALVLDVSPPPPRENPMSDLQQRFNRL